MPALPPLIPYLENIKRWIWLGIFGGAVLFVAIVLFLAATQPDTPANQLLGWANAWLFLIPAALAGYGVYVSARYWRCPQCGLSLPTKFPVWANCRRCGATLRGPGSERP
jgi:hypothetical protein